MPYHVTLGRVVTLCLLWKHNYLTNCGVLPSKRHDLGNSFHVVVAIFFFYYLGEGGGGGRIRMGMEGGYGWWELRNRFQHIWDLFYYHGLTLLTAWIVITFIIKGWVGWCGGVRVNRSEKFRISGISSPWAPVNHIIIRRDNVKHSE